MLLLGLTSCLSKVLVCGRGVFFLVPKALQPRFRLFSVVRPTQVFAFSKKCYGEGNYT